MKKIVVMMLFLSFFAGCDALSEYLPGNKTDKTSKDGKKSKDEPSAEETAYMLGLDIGRSIEVFDLSDDELDQVLDGLKDYQTSADKSQFEEKLTKGRDAIRKMVGERQKIKAQKVAVEGKKFYDEYVKSDGVKTTASGLAYKIIKEGSAEKATAIDTVTVHYHGTLTDGTVFDSSVERKKPATFPLNRVIKGWTEGMQLVGKGGKIELVIPASLGYGDRTSGKIPGGSILKFEIELLDIKKGEAVPTPTAK